MKQQHLFVPFLHSFQKTSDSLILKHMSNSFHWNELSFMFYCIVKSYSIHVLRNRVKHFLRSNLCNDTAFSRESSKQATKFSKRNQGYVSVIFSNNVKPMLFIFRVIEHLAKFHESNHISYSKSINSDVISRYKT